MIFDNYYEDKFIYYRNKNNLTAMSFPQVLCKNQNHFSMPLEYLCLHAHCIKNKQQLCCIYCCQQTHKSHLENIKAIKIVLVQFQRVIKRTQLGVAETLLLGIQKCRNQKELQQNISELLSYNIGNEKFQKIIDSKNEIQNEETRKFYSNRPQNIEDNIQRTVKKQKQPLLGNTKFITPVLTFSLQDAQQQGYQLKSPFCVVNSAQKLVTAFCYPPLNRYQDSTEINIKIQRLTPFWLGVGISFGKKKYQPGSEDHIMMTSNGWVSIKGKTVKSPIKYCLKDIVKVKLDSNRQLIEFSANGERHTIPIQMRWNEELYLSCVLYYKQDSVQILS